MTERSAERLEAFDPDDIMAALTRLRVALFVAVDEASTQGSLSVEAGREIALLGADVYVISKRLHPSVARAQRDRIHRQHPEDDSAPHRGAAWP